MTFLLDAGGFNSPIRVLQSIDAPSDQTNPYLVQLVKSLPESIDVQYFSMRRALFGRYDVFHIHWPEYMLRHRSALGTVLKQCAATALLLRLWLGRVPVVRTLHNERPHERGSLRERLLLAGFDRLTRSWIRLNAAAAPRQPQSPLILHGHYRDWFARHAVPDPVPGRLLFFGLVRGYKGIDALVEAMRASDTPGLTLRIVGNPSSEEVRGTVDAAIADDARISARLEYVGDDVLADEIGQAELVVLPYAEMKNSGALLLALSLNRPVLVPRNETNAALADEVGDGWIVVFNPPLDAAALAAALAEVRLRTKDAARPDLSQRDWVVQGALHARAYQEALHGVREGVGA